MQFGHAKEKRLVQHEAIHDEEYNKEMGFVAHCIRCDARFIDNYRLGLHQTNVHGKNKSQSDYRYKCTTSQSAACFTDL